MDIQLPEISGLEVTKWLKEDDELAQIPVVAVTAFAMKGDEERIREGGCEAYISKPISVSKFLETIRQFIGASEAGQKSGDKCAVALCDRVTRHAQIFIFPQFTLPALLICLFFQRLPNTSRDTQKSK